MPFPKDATSPVSGVVQDDFVAALLSVLADGKVPQRDGGAIVDADPLTSAGLVAILEALMVEGGGLVLRDGSLTSEAPPAREPLGAGRELDLSDDHRYQVTLTEDATFTCSGFRESAVMVLEVTITGGSVASVELPARFFKSTESADWALEDGSVNLVYAVCWDDTPGSEIVDYAIVGRTLA
jgi:hypothetical protein